MEKKKIISTVDLASEFKDMIYNTPIQFKSKELMKKIMDTSDDEFIRVEKILTPLEITNITKITDDMIENEIIGD